MATEVGSSTTTTTIVRTPQERAADAIRRFEASRNSRDGTFTPIARESAVDTRSPQERADDAIRRFQNAQDARNGLNRTPRALPQRSSLDSEAVVVERTPQEQADDTVRAFEDSLRRLRDNRVQTTSSVQRQLSVEEQNVDILIAQRSTARNLGNFIGTLNNARANASEFYRSSRGDGPDIRNPGTLFRNTR